MIVKALIVVLDDLTPGTMYSFKVRTVKAASSSRFSQTARNRTFEEGQSVTFEEGQSMTFEEGQCSDL